VGEITIRQVHLAEELGALDMSAAELARQIDVPTNRVTQILNETRAITGIPYCASLISLALARSFGSIYRASTTCGLPRRRLENPSRHFQR
jgi:plasmid maintenance system antidote protein VapI